jgi:anti-sigma28 factor (negative regulator of flagellin synthesis)
MISKVVAGNTAYMQQVSSDMSNKDAKSVEKSKELDKVESLKEQIKSGEYKFDAQKTAEAVAKDLM